MDYLHIAYLPAGILVRDIIGRLHAAKSDILRERFVQWGETELSIRGLSLATKLEILSVVTGRLDRQIKSFVDNLHPEQVKEAVVSGAGIFPPTHTAPFELLADIDAFIFESRSAYDIVGKFINEFFLTILDQQVTEDEIRAMIQQRGVEVAWIDELRSGRIRMFHDAAPWIAFCRNDESVDPTWDLVVLPDAKKDVTAPEVLAWHDLVGIYRGFEQALHAIRDWLIEKVDELDS